MKRFPCRHGHRHFSDSAAKFCNWERWNKARKERDNTDYSYVMERPCPDCGTSLRDIEGGDNWAKCPNEKCGLVIHTNPNQLER